MKQAENDRENRATWQNFKDRVEELRHRRSALEETVSAIAVDVALGKADIVAQDTAAKAEICDIVEQIATLKRAMDNLDADYEEGRPRRELAYKAARKAEAGALAAEQMEASAEADEGLKVAAAALVRREAARARLASFVDTGLGQTPSVSAVIFSALGAAGLSKFDPRFTHPSNEPGSVAEYDIQNLRLVLDKSHPAVVEFERRAAVTYAEKGRAEERERTATWQDKPRSFFTLENQIARQAAISESHASGGAVRLPD